MHIMLINHQMHRSAYSLVVTVIVATVIALLCEQRTWISDFCSAAGGSEHLFAIEVQVTSQETPCSSVWMIQIRVK